MDLLMCLLPPHWEREKETEEVERGRKEETAGKRYRGCC